VIVAQARHDACSSALLHFRIDGCKCQDAPGKPQFNR